MRDGEWSKVRNGERQQLLVRLASSQSRGSWEVCEVELMGDESGSFLCLFEHLLPTEESRARYHPQCMEPIQCLEAMLAGPRSLFTKTLTLHPAQLTDRLA